MKLLEAFLVVTLFWVSDQICGAAPGCRDQGGLYVAHHRKALIGHAFLSRPRTSRVQCMMLCVRDSRCLSFNHENTSGTCQLNSERREEFPESLQQAVGFSYFGGINPRAPGIKKTTIDEQLSPVSARLGTTTSSTKSYCCHPMGMESGAILDDQITALNVLNNDYARHGPTLARLNSRSAWCGKKDRPSPWIQVTFNQTVSFYGLIVQKHASSGAHLAALRLTFDAEANWGDSWANEFKRLSLHKGDKLLRLPHVVRSTFIRIYPTAWTQDRCLRFELLGCI